MPKLALFIVLGALSGCGGDRTSAGPLGQAAGEGNWFCEMAENGEDWDCIQDAELARSPKPTRLPGPKPTDQPAPDEPGPVAAAEVTGLIGMAPPEAPSSVATPMTDEATAPEPIQVDSDTDTEVDAGTELLDLPASHYALQVLAMSSASQLQDFIASNELAGAVTARVERNGELYYVLLLGVYDTLELAEQASLELPAPLHSNEAWIRSVGSLQNAVLRGNALALE